MCRHKRTLTKLIGKHCEELDASPRSRSPLLKKKLAPRALRSLKRVATVREMVDLPVPALPFSQNMPLPLGSPAHSCIRSRTSVRVSGWHWALCSLAWESKAASSAIGRLAIGSLERSADERLLGM